MPEISVVKNLPDVSFIDGATVEDIRGEMVADYEAFMSQATGRPLTLDRASPTVWSYTQRRRKSTTPCSTLTERASRTF